MSCFFKRQWLTMSETEALLPPIGTNEKYTWCLLHRGNNFLGLSSVTFKVWFPAPSHIYTKVKVNPYLKICVLEGVQKIYCICQVYYTPLGHRLAQLLEALCYRPKGVNGIFHWHNPSSHTMALGSTHPLTAMRTRNISWGVKAASG